MANVEEGSARLPPAHSSASAFREVNSDSEREHLLTAPAAEAQALLGASLAATAAGASVSEVAATAAPKAPAEAAGGAEATVAEESSGRGTRRASVRFQPEPERPAWLPKVQSGTLCFATVPNEAADEAALAIFASCGSRERIGALSPGQQVVAAGPPEEVNGSIMVPIRPGGAVDAAVLQLEPVKSTGRTARKQVQRRNTLVEAAIELNARGSTTCDPMEELPGERVLATALGMGGSAPGAAVADAIVPSSNTPLPVQVDVTNYRLRLTSPDVTGANLYVMVCSGQGLVAPDRGGPPDPFAVISLVGQRHRSSIHPRQTSVKTKTSDPVWNEAITFEGVSEQATLRVQLFDAGRSKGEDYVGEVQVRKVARLPSSGQGCARQWAVTLGVRYGDLDVVQVGDAPRLGSLRLFLRCTWPVPGSARGQCTIPLMCIEKACLDQKTQRVSVATKATQQFVLAFDTAGDAHEIHRRLSNEPDSVQSLLCLSGPLCPSPDPRWRFQPERELQRWVTCEATSMRRASPPDYMQRWRLDTDVNRGYGLCSTYPQEVVLPAALSLKTLRASANFRSKNRFPMISWVHPCNGAVLVRCSQPMVGSNINTANAAKCDRECLMAFASGEFRELTICDARPYKNAQANRVGGGGTETSLSYESCNVQFLDVENIHVMREALHGLRSAVCQQDDYSMYAGALTKWLHHLRAVIRGAKIVAEMVESGMSVVVHCSDGWDRTSQIVSLASVLLDGHYRTIKGLIDLVQKDWLLPGHKFRDRNGLASRKEQSQHPTEISPIFLQFLDALSQVWSSYPRHFEYTPHLLSFLLYHSLSGRYSNFLCNCEKEREEAGILEHGSCLWTEIMSCEHEWINTVYDEDLAREAIVPCDIPLQQHGFSRELYACFSTWWSDQSPWAVTCMNTNSFMCGKPSQLEARSWVRSPARVLASSPQQEENGGYIFCASRRTGAGFSRILACELLLRKFMGVATFPAQPVVRVVSHVKSSRFAHFVIELRSVEGDEMHYVTKSYNEFDALRIALKDQIGLELPVRFPPKMLFGKKCKGRDLEERLFGLNLWLRSAIACAWSLSEEEDDNSTEAERCCDTWMERIRMLLPALDPRPLSEASLRALPGPSLELPRRGSAED